MGTAKRPVVGITMGDPAGIGPEIIVKAILEYDINKICRPVVIGDAEVIKKVLKTCRLRAEIKVIEKIASAPAGSGKKEIINAAGFQYPGHTELLAELAGTKDFGLMMVGGGLRVILVTTHMALKDVFRNIKKDRVLRTIRLAHKAMGYFQTKAPRIAVAALNPHAGEGRLFGTEEWDEIMPAVIEARGEGLDVSDPLPADTLFHKAKERYYDIVVAMYHDQGLIPLKLLAFGKAVNVTVGLPFIRTSVDHGTAYDIAGKDCADPGSLIEAIKMAVEMVGYTHA